MIPAMIKMPTTMLTLLLLILLRRLLPMLLLLLVTMMSKRKDITGGGSCKMDRYSWGMADLSLGMAQNNIFYKAFAYLNRLEIESLFRTNL
jgi:hypothetical protein